MVTKLMVTNKIIFHVLTDLFFRYLTNAHKNGGEGGRSVDIYKKNKLIFVNITVLNFEIVTCILFVHKIKGLRYPDLTGL